MRYPWSSAVRRNRLVSGSNTFDKYKDVMSTMMELGAGESFDRNDILQKALATNKLSESVYTYLLSLTATSVSEMTFGDKVKLSTLALRDQVFAWAATPFGKAALIAAGIFTIIKLVDPFTTSVAESRKNLAALGTEFKENENKLQELNSELETAIKEIQSWRARTP